MKLLSKFVPKMRQNTLGGAYALPAAAMGGLFVRRVEAGGATYNGMWEGGSLILRGSEGRRGAEREGDGIPPTRESQCE